MLGTLAKWLRILGYDTVFEPGLDDHQLVRQARAEGRTILTCDRQLAERRGVCTLLVTANDLDDQVLQVLADLHLEPERSYSRCPVCNTTLQEIDIEMARTLVPAYVARTQKQFKSCPGCQRVYWRGTHWQKMEKRLSRLGQNAQGS